jgi:hypothetical protein
LDRVIGRLVGIHTTVKEPLSSSTLRTNQPITDPVLADLFKEELEKAGVDPKQFSKTVNLGDICVEVVPGENVILDPAASTFEDAEFAICKHSMDPSEIQARWNVEVTPGLRSGRFKYCPPLSGCRTSRDQTNPACNQGCLDHVSPKDGIFASWTIRGLD